jgi:isocitrate/isopropylmalate dehydrogenase
LVVWVGEKDAAASMPRAIDGALAAGNLTPDVGGTSNTASMTEAIVNQLE